MKKLPIFSLFILIISLFCLSGCTTIIDWGKCSFYQGKKLRNSAYDVSTYIRAVTFYDQLTTSGKFVALWLSDEVRKAYVAVRALKNGETEKQIARSLENELEENQNTITFYVLTLHQIPLLDAQGTWTLSLEIDGKQFEPLEKKMIELPSEYQLFFERYYTRFKVPYLISFSANDANGKLLIHKNTRHIALWFRSVTKENALCWNFDSNGKLLPWKYCNH